MTVGDVLPHSQRGQSISNPVAIVSTSNQFITMSRHTRARDKPMSRGNLNVPPSISGTPHLLQNTPTDALCSTATSIRDLISDRCHRWRFDTYSLECHSTLRFQCRPRNDIIWCQYIGLNSSTYCHGEAWNSRNDWFGQKHPEIWAN